MSPTPLGTIAGLTASGDVSSEATASLPGVAGLTAQAVVDVLAEAQRKARRGICGIVDPRIIFRDYSAKVIADAEHRGVAPATVKWLDCDLRRHLGDLGNLRVVDIRAARMEALLLDLLRAKSIKRSTFTKP